MPKQGSTGRSLRRLGIASVAIVATLLATTACSSSSSGGSASSGGSPSGGSASTSAPADDSSSSSAPADAGLTAARAAVAKYSQDPTKIGPSTPLNSAPPKGKTIVYLQCELSQCADTGAGVKAATTAIGWNYKQLSYQATNPATLVAAMKQALQYNPVLVALTGMPYVTWQSEVAEYQKAGVLIVPVDAGTVPASATVPANINGPSDINITGTIIADWIIADSAGKANILLWNVPDYQVLVDIANAFTAEIKKNCSACTIKTLNSTIAQVDSGAVTPAIVHTLQANPSYKYAFLSAAAFPAGVPAALKAAGLNGIKLTGTGSGLQNEQDLASGAAAAYTGIPSRIAGWNVVDVALRHLEGMTFDSSDGGLPVKLMTQDNVGTPSEDMQIPADYQQQFKTLWKVG